MCEVKLATFPGSDKFFEKASGIHVSGDGNRISRCAAERRVSAGKSEQYLEAVDANGKRLERMIAVAAERRRCWMWNRTRAW